MQILKPTIYLLAAIGLGVVIMNVCMSFGWVRSCDVRSLTTVVSPDGQREARLRIEKCNYESSPMVRLGISRQSNPKQEHSENIGIATSTELDVTWVSNEELRLTYPESFAVASTAPFLDGVKIDFVPKKIFND